MKMYNTNIQEAKGKKIKRVKRGSELMRESNPSSWLGQKLGQIKNVKQIEEKASTYLDELIDKRDDLNVKKQHIKKKLKEMENLREGERVAPSFFRRMKSEHKQEEYQHQAKPETNIKMSNGRNWTCQPEITKQYGHIA